MQLHNSVGPYSLQKQGLPKARTSSSLGALILFDGTHVGEKQTTSHRFSLLCGFVSRTGENFQYRTVLQQRYTTTDSLKLTCYIEAHFSYAWLGWNTPSLRVATVVCCGGEAQAGTATTRVVNCPLSADTIGLYSGVKKVGL